MRLSRLYTAVVRYITLVIAMLINVTDKNLMYFLLKKINFFYQILKNTLK
jgi:hypothetical protein